MNFKRTRHKQKYLNTPQYIRPFCPNWPIIWDIFEEKLSSHVHDHDGDKPKDSEHKHDNSNHDETSEFLDNSDTIEFEDDVITTTISPEKETTTDLGKTVETRLIARRHFIVKY